MEHYNKYIINIFERYTDLKNSNKQDFDNNDLWKIFDEASESPLAASKVALNNLPA